MEKRKKMQEASRKMDALAKKLGKWDAEKNSEIPRQQHEGRLVITAHHAGYVVDASVFVKWFLHEKESDRLKIKRVRADLKAGQYSCNPLGKNSVRPGMVSWQIL